MAELLKLDGYKMVREAEGADFVVVLPMSPLSAILDPRRLLLRSAKSSTSATGAKTQ